MVFAYYMKFLRKEVVKEFFNASLTGLRPSRVCPVREALGIRDRDPPPVGEGGRISTERIDTRPVGSSSWKQKFGGARCAM